MGTNGTGFCVEQHSAAADCFPFKSINAVQYTGMLHCTRCSTSAVD